LNAGAHFLDQSLQLFGTETMPNVLCRMDSANSFGDAEDYCKVILSGEGKPVIDIEISSCHAYPDPTYSIQGTTGGLKATMGRVDWLYFKPEEAPHRELELKPMMGPDGKPQYCKEELTWYEGSWEAEADTTYPGMQFVFYEMLYETLTQGKPLIVTPEQVRQQIAVVEECFRQNPKFAPEG
jgi:predicted dehydrogenase